MVCHVAILCEGSTLTPTFAKALCIFFCEAAGIMRSQGKPCIAYGSEIGKLDGWLAQLSRELCSDTYFIVRSEESLSNLQALGIAKGVGRGSMTIFKRWLLPPTVISRSTMLSWSSSAWSNLTATYAGCLSSK